MNLTINASGLNKQAVQEQLDAQRDPHAPHGSLKGGIIDHLDEYVEGLPDDALSVSVSVSAHVGYSVDQAQPAGEQPTAPQPDTSAG